MDSTIVIAFTHRIADYVEYVYVPFRAIESVDIDKDGWASIRTKAEASLYLNEEQTRRLKSLLDANAVHLDDEVAAFPGGA
ncbi:MAG: hypothetical protein J7601_09675 [Chloroflexi bacterium]|jgi:hypothetical protein|nr:hypothetical protein [Chloroflexota bacterium]